jgi:Asp-tRNA(Asn)/Glu-tRNA(Gln) amidotransferase A subunit family amidase
MAASAAQSTDGALFDLSTATIADIQAAMDTGALTAERLVELYLARIAAYDGAGPKLNSVITLNPQALDEARALDAERRESGPRGPLHGIAVMLKDVFNTKDMPTTGGFVPMAASQPDRDAFVVTRLRDAGAIILAKLNQTDWYGRGPSSGSSITGAALSPYNPEKYAGASSTGSGVATAAWLATVALGSDTGGSLVIPAALNNVVVIAGTHGLVSRSGMMWNSPQQENAGPMCRSVHDCAAVLDAIAGFDAADLATQASLGHIPQQPYTAFVDAEGLRGARLGVLREMVRTGPAHADGNALFEDALEAMQDAGALLLDPVLTSLDLPSLQAGASSAQYEQAFAADRYLKGLPPGAPIRSLQEMLDEAGDEVSPNLAENARIESLDRHAPFLAALEQQRMLRTALVALMERFALDALVLPYRTLPPPTLASGIMTATDRRERRNGLHAYTGLPTILVPGGFFADDGMPFAVQLLGRPFSEPTLIRLASGFEARTRHRKSPESTPPLPGEAFQY